MRVTLFQLVFIVALGLEKKNRQGFRVCIGYDEDAVSCLAYKKKNPILVASKD